jgi:hypothetical protein
LGLDYENYFDSADLFLWFFTEETYDLERSVLQYSRTPVPIPDEEQQTAPDVSLCNNLHGPEQPGVYRTALL